MSPSDALTSDAGRFATRPKATRTHRALRWTPLEEAVICNDEAQVVALLRDGASLRRSRGYRHVPLLLSAILHNRSEAIVRALLDAGADPRERGRSCPPLHASSQLKRPDLMEMLVEHGADPNRIYRGVTAAEWAGGDPYTRALLETLMLNATLGKKHGDTERTRL